MQQLILVLHVFAALMVILLVLLQQGKGAEVGAAFGSGASQTLFGSQGSATFLSRLTAWLTAIFFMTSLGLVYLDNRQGQHNVRIPIAIEPTVPVTPENSAIPVVPKAEDTATQIPGEGKN